MLGLVTEGNAFALEEKEIGGCVFFVLTLPKGELRRRIALQRGARELQRRRVRRCVFPEEFSQQDCFLRRGVRAVDVQPLLRKKAGQWALAERQARGLGGRIAVHADCLTADVKNALCVLLREAGCVSFPQIRGAEELQRQLRRDSGAVLRLCSLPRLSEAETLLDFSVSEAEGQALTLRMGETRPPRFLLPAEWADILPSHGEQLAAALWELGKIPADKIGVKSRI